MLHRIGLAAVIVTLLMIAPALPYGTVVTGRNAQGVEHPMISYNQVSPEAARELAIGQCSAAGNRDCRVVTEFSNSCVSAYVNSKSNKYYYLIQPDTRQAFEIISRQCRSAYQNAYYDCHPKGPFCDTPEGIQKLLQDKAAAKAREEQTARQKQMQAEAEERRRTEAAEREQRRQKAVADCGSRQPAVSGGPWFSSTYKIGALDEAARATAQLGSFLCIKTIEHISDAPNPFGGKAARARFTGYDAYQFNLKVEVRDFPY